MNDWFTFWNLRVLTINKTKNYGHNHPSSNQPFTPWSCSKRQALFSLEIQIRTAIVQNSRTYQDTNRYVCISINCVVEQISHVWITSIAITKHFATNLLLFMVGEIRMCYYFAAGRFGQLKCHEAGIAYLAIWNVKISGIALISHVLPAI